MEILKNEILNNVDSRLPGELAYSIKKAYDYLYELIEYNPILKSKSMRKAYGHIRNGFVDIAIESILKDSGIDNIITLESSSKYNNGYTYPMIEVTGAIITPVKTRSSYSIPKKALNRSLGSLMNKQYNFLNEIKELNTKYDNNPPFILLTYGGKDHNLEFIELGLPDVGAKRWIDKYNIINAPRIILNKDNTDGKERNLELSLTEYSKRILGDEKYGTFNI